MSSHQIKFLKNDFYKELAETLLIRNNKNNFISCYAVLLFFPLCVNPLYWTVKTGILLDFGFGDSGSSLGFVFVLIFILS